MSGRLLARGKVRSAAPKPLSHPKRACSLVRTKQPGLNWRPNFLSSLRRMIRLLNPRYLRQRYLNPHCLNQHCLSPHRLNPLEWSPL